MSSLSKSILHQIPQAILFQKISSMCMLVNSAFEVDELLEVSLEQTMSLFNAGRGSIFILNKNRKNLILKVSRGMENDERKRMVKRMGEGIVGMVAEQKKPIFVNDITKDDRFDNFKSRKSYLTPSFICTPLLIKDRLIGVINIADKGSGDHFDKDEMQLLDFLSSQIALNYHRLQLYKKFKTAVKETRNLKNKLGLSDQETLHLKKQISIQEKFATIGKLAGGIAHEFNNPLDGVMRYTNLCLDHIKDDEVVRDYLLEIKHGLNRMANIVKNLLACSRNDVKRKEDINFNEVLERSLSSIKGKASLKNIDINVRLEGDIPPVQDFGLERVLTNLLRNAVEATDNNGKIIILAEYENGLLTVVISDTGCGIPRDDIETIFEPFFTTKDIEKGCGLGLTIVHEIIRNYGGEIIVQSEPGKGTIFTINLPLWRC